jgi:hypothetical protein
MLSGLPIDEVIERTGLEGRLEIVEAEIAQCERFSAPAVADVTFRGNPVKGSTGIQANFAARAIAAFEKSVATIAASMSLGQLSDFGRVPERAQHKLMITGTALGSFGFRFEEVAESTSAEADSTVSDSLNQTLKILEGCATSDERLVDALGETSPRVLVSIKEFLTVMRNAEATCGVSVNGAAFRFESTEQVSAALERATTGVTETNETKLGILRDLMRDSRKFDFREESNVLISGKIDPEAEGVDDWFSLRDQPCVAHFRVRIAGRVTQVRRYILKKLEPRPRPTPPPA